MKGKINTSIKELKKLIKQDQIEITEAVDIFTNIVNKYNNRFETMDEQIILNNIVNFNSPIISLIEDRRKIGQRINELDKILILQELGITFTEKELKKLLKKYN